jgi:hypothetical protein
MLVSDRDGIVLPDLSEYSADAARSSAIVGPVVDAKEGRMPDLPSFFAEAYVPVLVGGRPVAVVAAYVDLTGQRDDFYNAFLVAAAALCGPRRGRRRYRSPPIAAAARRGPLLARRDTGRAFDPRPGRALDIVEHLAAAAAIAADDVAVAVRYRNGDPPHSSVSAVRPLRPRSSERCHRARDSNHPCWPEPEDRMTTRKSFIYGTDRIEYDVAFVPVTHSKISIHVYPDGSVRVDAPEKRDFPEIHKAVMKRAGWIKHHVDEFRRQRSQALSRTYTSGESVFYLGRRYQLKVRSKCGLEPTVKLIRGQICVETNSRQGTAVRECLADWYRNLARDIFARRFDEITDQVRWLRTCKSIITARAITASSRRSCPRGKP